jgi:hypothetical protein
VEEKKANGLRRAGAKDFWEEDKHTGRLAIGNYVACARKGSAQLLPTLRTQWAASRGS